MLTALMLLSCASTDYTRLYFTQEKAAELEWEAIGNLDHLGPTVFDKGTNFSLYSAHADRVELLLFDDPESDRPTQQFEMTPYGEVWNLYVEGVGEGQHYGFVLWGPNWTYEDTFYPGSLEGYKADVDEAGNRFNPNKLMFDPYGKVVHRDHDWGRGSAASGPYRQQSTYGASAKSVVTTSSYQWNDDDWMSARKAGTLEGHGPADAIIYEVHLKGSYKVTHAAWPYLREQAFGRIIFTASASGIYGNFGQANYGAAKLGLYGLAQTLAVEGRKRNIMVNTIAPVAGSRLTENLMPEEIASKLKPEFVSPLLVKLCHESSEETGGLFEVGAGWVGKVRIERSRGVAFNLYQGLSAEDIDLAWTRVTDFNEAEHPASMSDSNASIFANLKSL